MNSHRRLSIAEDELVIRAVRERSRTVKTSRVRLHIAEEQQFLREAYQAFFQDHPDVEVVGISANTETETLVSAVSALGAQVVLVGFKVLHPCSVERLEQFRELCPQVGIVLLSAYYNSGGVKALREFARGAGSGCAFILKHTIDSIDQLTQVILAVAAHRIILDPVVMDGLIDTTDARSALLKDLSPREIEVLSWIARGYRNEMVAKLLSLEPKTVERHINNIYSKLVNSQDSSMHARVRAVLMYLHASGQLQGADIGGPQ